MATASCLVYWTRSEHVPTSSSPVEWIGLQGSTEYTIYLSVPSVDSEDGVPSIGPGMRVRATVECSDASAIGTGRQFDLIPTTGMPASRAVGRVYVSS